MYYFYGRDELACDTSWGYGMLDDKMCSTQTVHLLSSTHMSLSYALSKVVQGCAGVRVVLKHVANYR